MKRLSLILCVVFILVAVAAVADEAPSDSGTALDSAMVILEANPTTGYTWTFEVTGDAVGITDQGLSKPETDAMGAPSTHSFVVEAVGPGEATITFTYAREFAPEEDPQEVIVEAKVDASHNLVLTTVADTRALSLEGLDTPTVIATLEANATTGFEWSAAMEGPFIVQDEGYEPDEAPESMVGVGGMETFMITATRAGEGTITFTYAQPWEEDTSPANTIVLSLTVDAQGNILLTR